MKPNASASLDFKRRKMRKRNAVAVKQKRQNSSAYLESSKRKMSVAALRL